MTIIQRRHLNEYVYSKILMKSLFLAIDYKVWQSLQCIFSLQLHEYNLKHYKLLIITKMKMSYLPNLTVKNVSTYTCNTNILIGWKIILVWIIYVY